MIEIKFRQPIFVDGKFNHFHYWGFLSDGSFVAPDRSWVDGLSSQQYTCLKDKNGKEIYEGDIVRVVDDPSHKYNIDMLRSDFGKKALVVWENRWASFGLSDGYDEALISKGGIGNLISSGFNCAEIIGNIYENPELLKG